MSNKNVHNGELDSEQDGINEELVRDFVMQLNRLQDRVDDLEQTIDKQGKLLDSLHTRNSNLVEILFDDEWSVINNDGSSSFQSIYHRLLIVEDDIETMKQRSSVMGSRGSLKPDERAQRLRQILFDKAKRLSNERNQVNGIEARLTRDEAEAALGGGLHRGTVLGAMKRAADGADAADRTMVGYTTINGASDLDASEGIKFTPGENHPGKTAENQSELIITIDDITGAEARQNLMTGTNELEGPQ